MLLCFTSEFDCGVGHLVLFFLHLSLTVRLDSWCCFALNLNLIVGLDTWCCFVLDLSLAVGLRLGVVLFYI